MRPALFGDAVLSLLFLAACGQVGQTIEPSTTSTGAPSASPRPPTRPAAVVYDLHEWGVVAVREGSFEVAAGAGQRLAPRVRMPAITVDKPVLYVHADTDAPFDIDVRVTLPETLSVAEHYPPTALSPLRWTARVEGQCRGGYPSSVDGRCPQGYCEVLELGTYETDDAACLTVAAVRSPLLFYRLWAPAAAPVLPLAIEVEGDTWVVENRGIDAPVGQLWRVRRDGPVTRASAVPVPARGQRTPLPPPVGDASAGWVDMIRVLRDRGLSAPEAAAFDRGWGRALFGDAAGQVDDVLTDGTTADGEVADEDRATVDELTIDDLPTSPGAPRDRDVLLYWLPDANIDALARVDAVPAPRHLRRAFLVRHVVE